MPFLRNVLLPLLEGVGKGVISFIVVAFKIAVPVIKIAATVLGAVGRAARPLRGVFAGIGTVIGFLIGGPVLKLIATLPKVVGAFRLMTGPIRLVTGALGKVGGAFGKLPGFAGRAVDKVVSFVGGLPGKIGGLIGAIARGFANIGRSIVNGIVSGIKAAPKAIIGAITSIIPKPLRGVLSKVGGALGGLFRAGGRVRRYASGGLVPIVASGGEMMVHNGAASMIGGPSDRDGTPMLAPAGAAILTGHGQQMMAGGASLNEAIVGQMPHFMSGGRVAAHMRRSGFKGQGLITGLAVSKGESGSNERAVNSNSNGSTDRGLFQINSIHGAKSTFDPQGNTDAAWSISSRASNWNPWVVFKKGLHRRHMAAAVKAARAAGSADGGSGGKTKGSDASAALAPSRFRSGLIADAFSQGQQAGQEGLTRGDIRRGGNPILTAIREALASGGTQPDKGGSSPRGTSQGDGAYSVGAEGSKLARMSAKAGQIEAKGYPYAWGGGHGRIGVPTRGTRTSRGGPIGLGYDCSGAVSAVLGAGGLLKAPLVSGGLMSWGKRGSGKNLAVYSSPSHVIMRIGSRFFGTSETNPNGGAGWLSSKSIRGGVTRTWPGFASGRADASAPRAARR